MHQSETHLLMTGMTVHALVKRLQLLMIRYAWAAFVSRIHPGYPCQTCTFWKPQIGRHKAL